MQVVHLELLDMFGGQGSQPSSRLRVHCSEHSSITVHHEDNPRVHDMPYLTVLSLLALAHHLAMPSRYFDQD